MEDQCVRDALTFQRVTFVGPGDLIHGHDIPNPLPPTWKMVSIKRIPAGFARADLPAPTCAVMIERVYWLEYRYSVARGRFVVYVCD